MAITLSRRSMLGFLAAPAIIRVADIMPVKALPKYESMDVFGHTFEVSPAMKLDLQWLLDAFEQANKPPRYPDLVFKPSGLVAVAGDEADIFIYR